MTVRRQIFTLLALVALLLWAGCGGSDRSPMAAETDEPSYREGQQFKIQGRYDEALSAFLRVIEKRGEQASAESHLEAGLIFLYHSKNPVFAIYHFQKYLELRPNAPQASKVAGEVKVAEREYARMLHAPNPFDAVQSDVQDQMEQLKRENETLKSELQALRGGAPTGSTLFQFPRPGNEAGSAGAKAVPPPAATDLASPLSVVTVPPPMSTVGPGPILSVARRPTTPGVSSPPTRPAAPAASGRRTHTVAPGDNLYRISVKYFGNGSKVDEIFNANRDVMPNKNTLPRVGTELKIP